MPIRTANELDVADHWTSALEPLAARVFPAARPAGWMRRKVERECVRADASPVLVDGDGHPLGYVLVGWPPSLGSTARTAGVAVTPELRGRGRGRRLLDAAEDLARGLGAARLRTVCPPDLVAFYARTGLAPVRERWTLCTPGLGTSVPRRRDLDWSDAAGVEAAAWLRETWQGSPVDSRHALVAPQASALLTAEAGGWLCHRLGLEQNAPDRWLAAADDFRRKIPTHSRLWLYGCPALGAGPIALLERGWRVAQRVVVLERELY